MGRLQEMEGWSGGWEELAARRIWGRATAGQAMEQPQRREPRETGGVSSNLN